jgi:hypothetical protein
MRTFEHAKGDLVEEIWTRKARGLSTIMKSLDIAATEDGAGAVIYLELADSEILHSYFDFGGIKINPTDFDPSFYESAFFTSALVSIN